MKAKTKWKLRCKTVRLELQLERSRAAEKLRGVVTGRDMAHASRDRYRAAMLKCAGVLKKAQRAIKEMVRQKMEMERELELLRPIEAEYERLRKGCLVESTTQRCWLQKADSPNGEREPWVRESAFSELKTQNRHLLNSLEQQQLQFRNVQDTYGSLIGACRRLVKNMSDAGPLAAEQQSLPDYFIVAVEAVEKNRDRAKESQCVFMGERIKVDPETHTIWYHKSEAAPATCATFVREDVHIAALAAAEGRVGGMYLEKMWALDRAMTRACEIHSTHSLVQAACRRVDVARGHNGKALGVLAGADFDLSREVDAYRKRLACPAPSCLTPHSPPRWLVVIAREGRTEATEFDEEALAKTYYDQWSAQWTESYLARVEAGPGRPVDCTQARLELMQTVVEETKVKAGEAAVRAFEGWYAYAYPDEPASKKHPAVHDILREIMEVK